MNKILSIALPPYKSRPIHLRLIRTGYNNIAVAYIKQFFIRLRFLEPARTLTSPAPLSDGNFAVIKLVYPVSLLQPFRGMVVVFLPATLMVLFLRDFWNHLTVSETSIHGIIWQKMLDYKNACGAFAEDHVLAGIRTRYSGVRAFNLLRIWDKVKPYQSTHSCKAHLSFNQLGRA